MTPNTKNGSALCEQSQSYLQGPRDRPFLYRTIGQHLREAADRYPNHEALVSLHEGLRYSYAEVLDRADRLAAGFYLLGLQKGDRVAIWAPNSAAYYLSTLAVARAGMISVGINPAYQIPELEYALNKVGVKALITIECFRERNYYEMLMELLPELAAGSPGNLKCSRVPTLKAVIIDAENMRYPGTISAHELLRLPSDQQVHAIESIQSRICPDSGACLLFTSGTTGKPKAALLSHFALINHSVTIAERNDLGRKMHRACVHIPLFHVYGLSFGVLSALSYGTTAVLPGYWFNASDSLNAIAREKCTVMYGTPTMYVDLLREYRKGMVNLHRMDLANYAAACCSPQLILELESVMGIRKVLAAYGMTELSGVTFMSQAEDSTQTALESVGRIADHYEAKVVDREGGIVPFGTPGELWVRGFGNLLGYWGDEDKTKEIMGPDGWLKTGDQFVLRPDGYGRIVGRIKELIIRGGENIYPREIEDVLNTHPAILESHCIGVPNERLGEEVCAYIRLKDSDGMIDMEEIRSFCKFKLAYFKIPKHLRIVQQYPKTPTGKVQKYELLKLFLSENKENVN
ncbi:2-succinylbenzoate-CoA ligase [Culex quinquefasciatus]|uniref:Medium-chain acyl-CoA ligase ACSF2, mitochondrial n=1 Tax=Culex quinquefasciatus TaxID=7176 RepID=B0W059_CULQU|nr:2-succinylbenzoate-CoA ligase [Culex quinquefasciatus]|eukprot:XP_001842093.1 2-succinylbenzoate-CoA ligase [Culex quinquefasciatus]